MAPVLRRGDVYFIKDVRLVTKKIDEIFRDKFALILQEGPTFDRKNKVNILLGTSKNTDNVRNTEVLVPQSEEIFPEDTKFNCSEIYLIHKEHLEYLTRYCTLSEEMMAKIDIALIQSLCLNLEKVIKTLEEE